MTPPIFTQESGDIFVCLKSSKRFGTVKGKHYVYSRGELRTYTTRNVTVLANGDQILAQPDAFVKADKCPFCGQNLTIRDDHDGVECAAEWDADAKHYCRDCGRDTKNGLCPKCDYD